MGPFCLAFSSVLGFFPGSDGYGVFEDLGIPIELYSRECLRPRRPAEKGTLYIETLSYIILSRNVS